MESENNEEKIIDLKRVWICDENLHKFNQKCFRYVKHQNVLYSEMYQSVHLLSYRS